MKLRLNVGSSALLSALVGAPAAVSQPNAHVLPDMVQSSKTTPSLPLACTKSKCDAPVYERILKRMNNPFPGFPMSEVPSISDEHMISLVVKLSNTPTGDVTLPHGIQEKDCSILRRAAGAFNHCAFVQVNNRDTYVIRVPFAGTEGSWTEADAEILTAEVLVTKLIRHYTNIPAPEVLAHHDGLRMDPYNFGFPFTVTKMVPGKSAKEIWFHNGRYASPSALLAQANCSSEKTNGLRHNFLRSLARTMSELSKISFDATGVPELGPEGWNGTIGVKARKALGTSPIGFDTTLDDLHVEHPSSYSSVRYFKRYLPTLFPTEFTESDPEVATQRLGISKVIRTILAHNVFTSSKEDPSDMEAPESFVLSHNDLDLQNILVDDDGNVTGILDWDGCSIVPRSVGFSSLPLFLRRDWNHQDFPNKYPYITWKTDSYRKVYIDAMLATGVSDAPYTRKSTIYQAVHSCMYEGLDIYRTLKKLFLQIEELQSFELSDILTWIGEDSPGFSEFLAEKLDALLQPDPTPVHPADTLPLSRELLCAPHIPHQKAEKMPQNPVHETGISHSGTDAVDSVQLLSAPHEGHDAASPVALDVPAPPHYLGSTWMYDEQEVSEAYAFDLLPHTMKVEDEESRCALDWFEDPMVQIMDLSPHFIEVGVEGNRSALECFEDPMIQIMDLVPGMSWSSDSEEGSDGVEDGVSLSELAESLLGPSARGKSGSETGPPSDEDIAGLHEAFRELRERTAKLLGYPGLQKEGGELGYGGSGVGSGWW